MAAGDTNVDSGGEVTGATRCAPVARGNRSRRTGETDFATTIHIRVTSRHLGGQLRARREFMSSS
jgi:hypothetical protein